MPDPTLAAALAQLGAAGLIGWMWLSERRAAAERDRQIAEAHERLAAAQTGTHVLISIVNDNTRALTALEAGQRALAALIERLAPRAREGA